jgi:hypothetical protein
MSVEQKLNKYFRKPLEINDFSSSFQTQYATV